MRVFVAAIVLVACAADRTPSRVTFSPPIVTTTAPTTPVRLRDVILHPEWVGHAVTVDVFERLFVDTRTPLVVSAFVADVGPTHFLFVEGPDEQANVSFMLGLMQTRPLRLHGIVATSEGGGFQIAVDHSEVTSFPPSHKLASVHELVREPAKWADLLVEVDATLQVGFEHSVLDREVWLDSMLSHPEVHCAPAEGSKQDEITTYRLHIIGFAHTRGHYGQGSGWAAEIVPTDVTFLDPKGDDCK
jgi:hypothetical protein